MFNCVYDSRLPPPCLSKAELPTQSSPFPFMVPLWSHCRSRSLSLMLSVNEVACIVPAAMMRRHGLYASSSSTAAAAALAFFTTEKYDRKLIFIFNSVCASWVRREEKRREGAGGWFTGRLCQEVALAFTVISANAMLCFSLIYPRYLTAAMLQ